MEEKEKKKKKGLQQKSENILKSLKEVECFLGSWKKTLKGVKLYHLLKK